MVPFLPKFNVFASNLELLWVKTRRPLGMQSPVAIKALNKLAEIFNTSTAYELDSLGAYLASKSFNYGPQMSLYAKLSDVTIQLQQKKYSQETTKNFCLLIRKTFNAYKSSRDGTAQLSAKLQQLTLSKPGAPEMSNPLDTSCLRFICTQFATQVVASPISNACNPEERIRLAFPIAVVTLYVFAKRNMLPIAKDGSALQCMAEELAGALNCYKNGELHRCRTFPTSLEEVGERLFTLICEAARPEGKETIDATTVASCKELVSFACKEFSRMFSEETIEPEIAYAVEESELQITPVIDAACLDEPLQIQQADVLRGGISDLKEGLNLLAVRKLFEELEQDNTISPSIVLMLRNDWDDKGTLIGTSIKKNREFLTQERCREIIAIAKKASLEAAIRDQLEQVGQKLRQDVLQGRLVVTSQLERQYPEFYALHKLPHLDDAQKAKWAKEFQGIVNRVYIQQAIKMKQKQQRDVDAVEDLILTAMGKIDDDAYNTQKLKAEAELEVMRLLLEGEGIETQSLQSLEELMRIKKMEARLTALGVEKAKIPALVTLLPSLKQELRELHNATLPWASTITDLPETFPLLAKRALLKSKKAAVAAVVEDEFTNHIYSMQEIFQKKVWGISDLLEFSLPASLKMRVRDGSSFTSIDQELIRYGAFYENWGHRIVREMRQGFNDLDAIFHEGTCHGITTRWVVNEQKYPALKAEDFVQMVDVGTIRPSDRFRQLCLYAKHFLVDGHKLVHRLWSPQFLKKEKIRAVRLFREPCDAKTSAEAIKRNLDACLEQLAQSEGALYLLIKSHCLSLRIDPRRNIYRLGDVNVGLLDFSQSRNPLRELYDCLNDLIGTKYSDNNFVEAFQFLPVLK